MYFAIYCLFLIINIFLANTIIESIGMSDVILFQSLANSSNIAIYKVIIWLLFSLFATCIYEFSLISDYKFCSAANGYLASYRQKIIQNQLKK